MTYKVLGQIKPAAGVLENIYTVPNNKSTVTSSLTICNHDSETTFSIVVRINGEALSPKQYIAFNLRVPSNDTIPMVLGMTLGPNDVVGVSSANGNVSFNLFGSEV